MLLEECILFYYTLDLGLRSCKNGIVTEGRLKNCSKTWIWCLYNYNTIRTYIHPLCPFHNFMHFCAILTKCPYKQCFLDFTTYRWPHKNIKLGFYCSNVSMHDYSNNLVFWLYNSTKQSIHKKPIKSCTIHSLTWVQVTIIIMTQFSGPAQSNAEHGLTQGLIMEIKTGLRGLNPRNSDHKHTMKFKRKSIYAHTYMTKLKHLETWGPI